MRTQLQPGLSRERLVNTLLQARNADGGWGAHADGASNAECTALACLALRAGVRAAGAAPASLGADGGSALDDGERWLLARQQRNGAWYYSDAGAPAPWPTPLVLLALLPRRDAAEAVDRGYAWLLSLRGARFPWRQRVREFITRKQIVELDSTLEGWPWTPGAFPWVEPTSWALLALKARWRRAPRAVRSRIRQGEAMLQDRACPGGGWNYGNSRVMGQDLEPYPDTTAIALLGLRGTSRPVVDRGFHVLDALLDEKASALALSLAILCRRAWSRAATSLEVRLAARLESQGFPSDHRTLALAALAGAGDVSWLQPARNA